MAPMENGSHGPNFGGKWTPCGKWKPHLYDTEALLGACTKY